MSRGDVPMDGAEAKRALNEQFARIAKAVAHPKRVEILDLLAQGERDVNAVADSIGMKVTTASAHLQVLRQTRLVETRRDGTRIIYRPAGDDVGALLASIRSLAAAQLAEVDQIVHAYFDHRDDLEPLASDELARRIQDDDVIVLDVRPAEEYAAAHITGAVSIPLDQLDARLEELPEATEIVAYCRGPYCVLAPEAVALLGRRGRRARRLDDGLPEWRRRGLPVTSSAR